MKYFLSEEELMVKELAHRIAEEKIIPVRQKYDEEEIFPHDIVKIMAESDLFRVFIPEEYGGLGAKIFPMVLAVEELSWGCGGIALAYAGTALGAFPIILFGSEEQKSKYLPKIAEGTLAAFALTEAEAGSDAANIKTRAEKDGDYYILNGTKQFITNAGEADIYTVIALTDPNKGARGATAFILEKGMEGLEFGKKENKMGIRASVTREVIMKNVRVHKSQVLGKEGRGFIVAMKTFDHTRPGVAAQALGIAQAALDAAVKYANQRYQFGKPIASFQAIQHMIADMGTKVEATRALIYSVARAIDAGFTSPKESAMTKVFASDVAMEVTTNAVQIFGGYGYMKEYPVEKMMRDAKITQIYEGTNQILRNVIASRIIKEAK
ncbi:MAG: acyl-CoA dehydrogenase family protein [Candidatus Aminicenantes bacterium]|nr:acyl-CoA dehydrogenase family protein [Candidatus Aminicenantes bacterium]